MSVSRKAAEKIKDMIRKRKDLSDPRFLKGADRVDIVHEDGLRHRIRVRQFSFLSDEPESRAGTDRGPNPLAYFLAGAISCLLTQYVKLAVDAELDIHRLEATARGHFSREIGGTFTKLIYDIHIDSNESERVIRDLAAEAEEHCYVHNTLKKALDIETTIHLNGRAISPL